MKVKKLHPQAIIPSRATANSAGLDLFASESATVLRGQRKLVGTGIAVELPVGFVGMVCPRSGLAIQHGITVLNAPGIIDADYRGEIKVILINHSDLLYHIEVGERIAQLIIARDWYGVPEEVQYLQPSSRGSAGFGSTGD